MTGYTETHESKLLLRRLQSWAKTMGGWDAPVWRDVEAHLAKADGAVYDQAFGSAFRHTWPALIDANDDREVNGGDVAEWCASWWDSTLRLNRPQSQGETSEAPEASTPLGTAESRMSEPQEPGKRRFYVTMLWHDQPEGGSFGTVIEAADQIDAQSLCKQEMALCQAEGWDDPKNAEEADWTDPDYWLREYGDSWETVDCFDLDDFIIRHMTPETVDKWVLAAVPDVPDCKSWRSQFEARSEALNLIKLIARLKSHDDFEASGDEMDGDDACGTLSNLIGQARKIVDKNGA